MSKTTRKNISVEHQTALAAANAQMLALANERDTLTHTVNTLKNTNEALSTRIEALERALVVLSRTNGYAVARALGSTPLPGAILPSVTPVPEWQIKRQAAMEAARAEATRTGRSVLVKS